MARLKYYNEQTGEWEYADVNFSGSSTDGFTETDPTVPAWAKKSTKPTYGASEISYDPGEVGGSSAEATNVESALRGHREWLASLEETMIDCVKVFRRINGKTLESDIELTAADVGALPSSTTIPSKTSQLTNDSGFLTSAPVTKVNNKTGAVTLTASDVGAVPTTQSITVTGVDADGVSHSWTMYGVAK